MLFGSKFSFQVVLSTISSLYGAEGSLKFLITLCVT
nr:MAG TPA: hypothetical protein [Caudoviricetes sp.]